MLSCDLCLHVTRRTPVTIIHSDYTSSNRFYYRIIDLRQQLVEYILDYYFSFPLPIIIFLLFFFFLIIRPPPRSPLFPYPTLFRSGRRVWGRTPPAPARAPDASLRRERRAPAPREPETRLPAAGDRGCRRRDGGGGRRRRVRP